VPSLMSVTNSTPPGLKAIWRACGTSAKTAIWNPGGSFRRPKSSFSAWLQESNSKGNRAEIQARTGAAPRGIFHARGAAWMSGAGTAAGVTGLLQLFAVIFCGLAHAVFISDSAKITRQRHFFGPFPRVAAVQCIAGKRLRFPVVWHLTCYTQQQALSSSGRRYFLINAGAEPMLPTWRT